ncbi:MAG: dTDP-4-dehydrorhamnose 3,5-epimerase [Saprospiraceae bacterium]|nr:dTDP-4-dehydrorhamnose 3,5-epimerase [Saprospiraceae bacterium]
MKVTYTDIEGLLIIEPKVWPDSRGYFFESFQYDRYMEAGVSAPMIQDNEAFSGKGVLRGLHYQVPPMDQGKLVRAITGSLLDVAVDIRPGSPTYGKHHSIILSDQNKLQFYIPPGFAHGYLCLSDDVIFAYKCSNYYSKSDEGGIIYNDPTLNIDWQFDLNEAIISEKDLHLPYFGNHKPWPVQK